MIALGENKQSSSLVDGTLFILTTSKLFKPAATGGRVTSDGELSTVGRDVGKTMNYFPTKNEMFRDLMQLNYYCKNHGDQMFFSI